MRQARREPLGGSFRRADGAALAAAVLLAAGVLACGGPPDRMEITQERTASAPSMPAVPGATSAQRFGNSMGGAMGAGAGGMAAGAGSEAAGPLAYDLPDGWEEMPTSGLRPVNLRPAGNPDAECYVTVLGGQGGGLVANVDRWRKQLGLEAMTPEEASSLADVELLGESGKLVDLEGAYRGMGDDARAGWKLLGVVLVRPDSAVFVKLTGPAALVEAERARFLAFCASLREGGTPSSPHAAVESGAGSGDVAELPPGHPGGGQSSRFSWEAPAGWAEGPARSMREVTFAVGAQGECYIALLGGAAGGLVPNLDRWRNELGLPATTPQEVAALERVPMLGHEAVVFVGEGTFSSMGSEPREGYAVLGAICLRDSDAVFVKMFGPREDVLERRGEFTRFLRSMKEVAQ